MNPSDWPRIKELLNQVLDLEHAARAPFLDASGVDPQIRKEVESLMTGETEAEHMMAATAIEFTRDFVDVDGAAEPGKRIGPYRIISELGHGGMGAVYLAERDDGKFSQRVALKLLKRELNTGAFRRHFEREREILASLEHTNIARLLDAGTTDDEIPYIAMEFIDGLPIDEYCAANGLGLTARLELFRTVCGAVEFAHRNLVVHRDLKPSNVLVTNDGVPKLLDFGISKILSSSYETGDAATITRMGIMTPSYAAPEQLGKKGVTTLSDVYSLGVILFELLSGHRPFENKENDLRAIYDAVMEREPSSPSSVVSQPHPVPVSAVEQSPADGDTSSVRSRTTRSAHALSPQSLRGDLDNIVLKAIRKEPERRYHSAAGLSDDIRRHLEGLPVTARPNTMRYRAAKFVRRNRVAVAAAVVVAVAVIAGILATLWQASIARAERVRAERRFNDVRKLANSYLFDVYPVVENLEGSLKAREAILVNALAYLDSLSGEAGGDRELQAELATAYEKVGDVQGAMNNSSLGNIQAGLESYRKAAALREAVLAAAPADIEAKDRLANNYYVTARTLWNNSQTKEAEEAFERGLTLRRELVAAQPDSVEMKNRLAVLLIDYGAIPAFNAQADRAVALFNEAHSIIEGLRSADRDNPDLKKSQTRLIRVMSKAKAALGDHDGALRDLRYAIEVSNELARQFPSDFRVQRSVWLTESILCETLIDRSDAAAVVAGCVNTIGFPEKALAAEPENGVVAYDLAISHFNLSRAYRITGQAERTIDSADKAIEVMTALSRKTPDNLEYKRNLAVYLTERARGEIMLRRFDAALTGLGQVIDSMNVIAAADKETTTYLYDLGMAHRLAAEASFAKGDRPAAAEHIDRAITIIRELRDKNSLRSADNGLLAELEGEQRKYAG